MLVAWLDIRSATGDSIAYFDLSDAVRFHRWHDCFNASWFPLYPFLLTLARGATGFSLRYEAASARVLDGLLGVGLLASASLLALEFQRYAVACGVAVESLISRRTLVAFTVAFTFFFWSVDMAGVKPDALLTCLLLLAVAFLLKGLSTARWSVFAAAGALAGLAYWAKAFAFPFLCLVFLFVGITQIKRPRAFAQIAFASAIFLLVVAPYVIGLSHAKHRFTIGDAGRLNSAWYVNGAERFNPVADRAVDDRAGAHGEFLHPAQLLSTRPEIVYYPPAAVFGAFPAWDDFSYWSDGLASHFSLADTGRAVRGNLVFLAELLPMRLEAVLLLAALWVFGYRISLRQLSPVALALMLSSVIAVGLYLAVHLEGRYIVFAAIIVGTGLAAGMQWPGAPVDSRKASSHSPAHRTVLLLGWLLVVLTLQSSVHEFKWIASGDQPLKARFDLADFDAGQALGAAIPADSQVACLGLGACYSDALWARYAKARITAVVTLPHQMESASATAVCSVLAEHPESVNALRMRGVKAIVADFTGSQPCSPAWQKLAGPGNYAALPL
jgi:hypothetical protein